MQVILNEQGYVTAYATVGGFGKKSVYVQEPKNFDDFEKNYDSYRISKKGILTRDEVKYAEMQDKYNIAEIRSQREISCFPYVNRGYMWYSMLTDNQKEEFSKWYQSWLDATETKIIPEKPEWLV